MPERQNRKSAQRPKASDGVGADGKQPSHPEPAFDLWLRRGLHQLFDEVAQEPIPEALLRLIQGDEGK